VGYSVTLPGVTVTLLCSSNANTHLLNLLTFILTYILTYTLTPWKRVLLEKLTGSQLAQKLPAFYGTRRFITAFTRARHLSSNPCLGLASGLFPLGFLTKILYAPVPSPICAKCCAHFILLYLITRTILGKEYRSGSSSLCSFLHFPVTPSHLDPNSLLNTLFSNTLSFLSSLIVSDQVSNPYKTTGEIILLYVLIFIFLDSNWKTKDSVPNDSKHSLTSAGSSFLPE